MCHAANWVTLGKLPYPTSCQYIQTLASTHPTDISRAPAEGQAPAVPGDPGHPTLRTLSSHQLLYFLHCTYHYLKYSRWLICPAPNLQHEKVSSMTPGAFSPGHSLSLQYQAHTDYTVLLNTFLKDWESLTWSPLPLDACTSVGKAGGTPIKSIKLHFPEGPGLPPAHVAHWACPGSGSRLLWQGIGPPPQRPPACPSRTKWATGTRRPAEGKQSPVPSQLRERFHSLVQQMFPGLLKLLGTRQTNRQVLSSWSFPSPAGTQ